MPSHSSFVPHLMGQLCVTLCSLHFDRLCDLCASHFDHSIIIELMNKCLAIESNNQKTMLVPITQWSEIKFGFNFATFNLTINPLSYNSYLPLLVWGSFFYQMPWLIIVETFNHLSHITFQFLAISKFLPFVMHAFSFAFFSPWSRHWLGSCHLWDVHLGLFCLCEP